MKKGEIATQGTWLAKEARLREQAAEIIRDHPEIDPTGVLHVLHNLERTPTDRLRRALSRGRLRSQRR